MATGGYDGGSAFTRREGEHDVWCSTGIANHHHPVTSYVSAVGLCPHQIKR
jgi:hypothetical protein